MELTLLSKDAITALSLGCVATILLKLLKVISFFTR
jgi:hypothetical protein